MKDDFFFLENLGSRHSRHLVRLIFFSLLSFSVIIGLSGGMSRNPSALGPKVNAHLIMHVIIEQFKRFYCFSKFFSSNSNSWKTRSCCWQKFSLCYCESVNFPIQLCCIFYPTLIYKFIHSEDSVMGVKVDSWLGCHGCIIHWMVPTFQSTIHEFFQFVTERFLACWLISLLIKKID